MRKAIAGLALIGSITLYLLPPPANVSKEMMLAGALVVFSIGFWATGMLPEYLTSLIFFLVAAVSKVAPVPVIFSGLSSTALWLVLGGIVLAASVQHTGLANRLARWLLGFFGTSYAGLISGIVILAGAAAFFIPATMGRIALFVPIVVAMADRLGFKEGTPGRTGMVLAAMMGCYLPSCAVLPSNVPNMVLAGTTESVYNLTFHYGEYLKFHYPVLGVLKGFLLIGLTCFLFPDRIPSPQSVSHEKLEPLNTHEWLLALILSAALVLWGTDALHRISPAWVALGAASVCMLPFTRLLPPEAFSRGMNLGPFFYVAGVLGVGAIVAKTGLGDALGKEPLKVAGFKPGYDFRNFISLVFLNTVVSPFTTSPGLPVVMVPLASDIAKATGFPLMTVLMTQAIGFSNLIFLYQVPPLVVGMQLGGVKAADAAKLMFPLVILSIVVLMPANYLWWHILDVFGTGAIP